jgi:hypothetical protein
MSPERRQIIIETLDAIAEFNRVHKGSALFGGEVARNCWQVDEASDHQERTVGYLDSDGKLVTLNLEDWLFGSWSTVAGQL